MKTEHIIQHGQRIKSHTSIDRFYPEFFKLWANGTNCLLHHRFSFGTDVNSFLLFFTAPENVCSSVYYKLKQLFPSAKFTVVVTEIKLELYPFLEQDHIKTIPYPAMQTLDPGYFDEVIKCKYQVGGETIVLFCHDLNLNYNADPHQIFYANEHYRHLNKISQLLKNDLTFFVGPELKVHWIEELFPRHKIVTRTGEFTIPDSLMSRDELQALYDHAIDTPTETVMVEIGHYLGGSTVCLAKAACDGNNNRILTVDPHAAYSASKKIYLENIKHSDMASQVSNFFCTSKDFMIYHWPQNSAPVGLVFIDADKEFSQLNMYLNFWREKIVAGGYLILEDYSACFGVLEAVSEFLAADDSYRILKEVSPMLILEKITPSPLALA